MLADVQDGVGKAYIVVAEYRLHAHLDKLRIGLGQRSHHAKVKPDYAPIPDMDIAGVRIGVEKSILCKLLYIVIYELRADLLHIVALLLHRSLICQLKAADVFHDEDMLC